MFFKKKQAQIPPERRQKEIKDLAIGETGWAPPWAMSDSNTGAEVRGDYPIYEECGQNKAGTALMWVKRTKNGVKVDISRTNHRYDKRDGSGMMKSWHPLPVTEIVT